MFNCILDDADYAIVVDKDKRIHNVYLDNPSLVGYNQFKEKISKLVKLNAGAEIVYGLGYVIYADNHGINLIDGYKGVFPYLVVPVKNNKKKIFPICIDKSLDLLYCCDTSKISLTLDLSERLDKKIYFETDNYIYYYLKFIESPLMGESEFKQYRLGLLDKIESKKYRN